MYYVAISIRIYLWTATCQIWIVLYTQCASWICSALWGQWCQRPQCGFCYGWPLFVSSRAFLADWRRDEGEPSEDSWLWIHHSVLPHLSAEGSVRGAFGHIWPARPLAVLEFIAAWEPLRWAPPAAHVFRATIRCGIHLYGDEQYMIIQFKAVRFFGKQCNLQPCLVQWSE